MKIQTQQSLENMFSKQFETVNRTMTDVYKSGYYHTAYEIQKGFNIGCDIAGLNQNEIEKVIIKPWAADRKSFSERIWGNKNKLINEIHTELTQNIMLGKDPQKAINAIAKKMNTSKHNAGRFVMTEEAYFSSAAQKDCFKELGVEKYKIVATLDSSTSNICQDMDGQVFDMKDYSVGSTTPPFHVNCRSTTAPYFDDAFGERAARDKNVKTYYIPDNISYKEWKEKFVDGGEKSDFEYVAKGVINKITGNSKKVMERFTAGIENIKDDNIRNIFKKLVNETSVGTSFRRSSYHANGKIFLADDATISTVTHELFHRLDKDYGISKSGYLTESIQNDYQRLKNFADVYGKSIEGMLYFKYPEAFFISDYGKLKLKDEYRGISDILNGMSDGEIWLGYGHKPKYWKNQLALEKETFAQFGRALYGENEKVIDMMKFIYNDTYPNVMNKLMEVSEDVLR